MPAPAAGSTAQPGFSVVRLVLQRLGAGVLLVVLVATLVFAALHLAPGDPIAYLAGPRVPQATLVELRALWGLDDPLPVQWWRWISGCVRGDFGTSFTYQQPVARVIGRALPATVALALAATLVQLTLGIGLGGLAALARGRWLDQVIRLASLVTYSIPSFWLAVLAIKVSSGTGLPTSHFTSPGSEQWPLVDRALDVLRHLALPSLALGISTSALAIRLTRNTLLDVVGQPWMLAARARGESRAGALWRHGLPNAAPPLLQLLAVQTPAFLSGSLVVEIVFAWPGLGQITYAALQGRDLALVLATTVVAGALTVVFALLADLAQLWLDPRLRREAQPS